MPAVSVIMPAYNVAPYLGAAIESVLGQTFTDFELLVVDDGSTDASWAIAERYAATDTRIRPLRQPNGGISAARNHGLRVASGEFFAILDSDDVWMPAWLGEQLAILRARPDVDIVTGNAFFLGSRRDGQPARPHPDPRPQPTLGSMIDDETAVFVMSVFRRRVYDRIGGFDEAFRCNEDYDFWLRAAAAGFRFVRNDRPLARYRQRDDSLSAAEVQMLEGILRVYAKLQARIADRPVEAAQLRAQVARFEAQLLRTRARTALERRDYRAASVLLDALHAKTGGAALAVVKTMARWAPGLLHRAYHLRRARLEAQA
jgi:glycosyltransferase involved in cell wall biosynthesis